jgi:hypothetical protein
MALATFASQGAAPGNFSCCLVLFMFKKLDVLFAAHLFVHCIRIGCDWRVQTSCADAKYAQYFTGFWQAVMGVYFITLICCLPLACSRWQSLKESAAKLPPGAGLKGRIACVQTADWLVLQLLAGVALRLIQSALLLLHADSVLPRMFFEILFELCVHSSIKFAHMFLEFLTLLVSKLGRRGTTHSTYMLLQPGQLFALDCATFTGFVLLGCLDGLSSGVRSRGVALWWYLAAVALLYLLLFKQVAKGMRQVDAIVITLSSEALCRSVLPFAKSATIMQSYEAFSNVTAPLNNILTLVHTYTH